ncbi:putative butyrate kinase 2 [Salinivirga cyanobacteriivorans]|uniref:Probable butyrate kinase n=1 Tax=Salinivirga cyanobacteriivorans TaxID=1307839 RepID=A0A0S2I2T2_9BACT|nr:butyrate kinase [Salinivirga cyanobacteriivorans]ALO16501.1 putative butyrate kinase 2 [Salinivirga cyanobacteriivorans]
MQNKVIIVINPGSTSTKIAFYNREGELSSSNISHPQSELQQFEKIADQLDYRYQKIKPYIDGYISDHTVEVIGLVGRGGIVKPINGGTYRVNAEFLQDARSGQYGEHASNLGSLLVHKLKGEFSLPECYTVDPVSTSRLSEVAKISGVPGIVRDGRAHTLNVKMTARKLSKMYKVPFAESDFVVAHLGGGISIGLVSGGRIVDVNDGLLGMGPFSPNRAGALPLRGVMKLCYSKPEAEVKKLFSQNSGLKAYLGTEDLREVLDMIDKGNTKAELIYNAFVYQVAKEIGACFAASKGRAHAIGITGGIAHSQRFTDDLKKYVGRLTDYHVLPGESEMEALAEGFYRVYDGEEKVLEYPGE